MPKLTCWVRDPYPYMDRPRVSRVDIALTRRRSINCCHDFLDAEPDLRRRAFLHHDMQVIPLVLLERHQMLSVSRRERGQRARADSGPDRL
jgi:hypothetical protein